jgi:ribosomal protein S18 acetylase RimI-like enzyme
MLTVHQDIFYVCTTMEGDLEVITGFFSKGKVSVHPMSCLAVLPPYRKMGIGHLLIRFGERDSFLSYEMLIRMDISLSHVC